jgi:CubicO group peptidase (beta-lactamase class C family)
MDLQPIAASLCRPDPASADGATAPPGALVGLALGDRQWVAAHGWAQRLPGASPVPFTLDTRTDAGSVTKIIATTAALMRLVDSEAVRLTNPVESIIGLGLPDEITVDDLLQHQAGLWEWWPLYLRTTEPAAAIRTAAALPRRYPRRSGRHYSDLGFMLLGAVISTVTEMALDRACTELSFSPYALATTRFRSPVRGAEVAASSYGDVIEHTMINTGSPYPVTGSVGDFDGWRDHPLIGEVNDGNSFHAHRSCAGHAGVFTTAGDLLRFGRTMLDSLAGNGPIGQPTARRFTSPGDDPAQGLGWRIWPTPAGPAVGHTGFPGVGFAILPERDAVLVMITNRLHVHGRAHNLEHLWQQCLQTGVAMIMEGAPQ